MATPRVRAALPAGSTWTSVEGAAASIAGVTWQNVGDSQIELAFTTAAPAGGATDAFFVLVPDAAYYDQNGSAKVWARSVGGQGGLLTATSD